MEVLCRAFCTHLGVVSKIIRKLIFLILIKIETKKFSTRYFWFHFFDAALAKNLFFVIFFIQWSL